MTAKSPAKKKDANQFKVPEEKFVEFVLIEKSKLTNQTIPENSKQFQILKEKSSSFLNEVEKLASSLNTSIQSPEGQLKKRLSTSTDLSSNSASTAGYLGDNSSGLTTGSSTSSGSLNRSRYSLNPYSSIDPHNTVPPLPGRGETKSWKLLS